MTELINKTTINPEPNNDVQIMKASLIVTAETRDGKFLTINRVFHISESGKNFDLMVIERPSPKDFELQIGKVLDGITREINEKGMTLISISQFIF